MYCKFLVRFEIKKCKVGSIVDDDVNCELYLHLPDGLDACTILNSTMFGVQHVLEKFNPVPRCPLKKGLYIGSSVPNLKDIVK